MLLLLLLLFLLVNKKKKERKPSGELRYSYNGREIRENAWILGKERNLRPRFNKRAKCTQLYRFRGPRFTSRPSGRCIRGGVVRHRLYRFDREPDGKLECLRTPAFYIQSSGEPFEHPPPNRKLISWERQSMIRFLFLHLSPSYI